MMVGMVGLIGICAFFIWFFYRLYRKIYHPTILFLGIWLIIFVLYSIQLFSTVPLDDKTLTILYIQIIAFSVGSLVTIAGKQSRSKRLNIERTRIIISGNNEIRQIPFFILCAFTIAVLLRDEITIIIDLIHGNTFSQIMRQAGGKTTVEISGARQVMEYMFIVHPMTACVSPICAVEFFTRKGKMRFMYLGLNLAIVALNVVHHGGRNSMIVFLICYLLCFFILGKRIVITKKVKRILLFLVFAGAILFTILSTSRGINEIWLSAYAYVIATIPLCGIYLNSLIIAPIRTYGFMSLKGITYPVMSVLSSLFGLSSSKAYQNASMVARYIEDNYVRIGDYSATGTNAFLPAGAYPYIDGGYIFEFIVMALYGVVAALLFERYNRISDKKNICIYLMFTYGIILSFARFYFTNYQYTLGMVYIVFLLYRKKNKSNATIENASIN